MEILGLLAIRKLQNAATNEKQNNPFHCGYLRFNCGFNIFRNSILQLMSIDKIIKSIRAQLHGKTIQIKETEYHIVLIGDIIQETGSTVRPQKVLDALRKTELNFITGIIPDIIYIQC